MDLSFYSQCLWFYLTHEPLFIFCGRVSLVDERLVLLLYCVFSGMVTFTPFYLFFYCIWSIVINYLFYFTFYLLLLKKKAFYILLFPNICLKYDIGPLLSSASGKTYLDICCCCFHLGKYYAIALPN
jgi:hypothetical protein